MKKKLFLFLAFAAGLYALAIFNAGCAQIGYPTGGPKDSIAPVLVKASPENNKTNFTGNRITLVFDEYIEIKDIQSNLMISPLPKNNPTISSNLKTISIKLKDTLQPNTTYSINFGNGIVDINESNALKNFAYTFSTGDHIDSLNLKGTVILAETGKTDSTLMVYLYKNASDSDITARRPDYISRLNGRGEFSFQHLPAASFRIYALKDGDGGKTYNAKSETFAFLDSVINPESESKSITLVAYAEEKAPDNKPAPPAQKKTTEKKLRVNSSASTKFQDLLQPLSFTFTNGLKTLDLTKIIVSDTNFNRLPNLNLVLDSTHRKVTININWVPEKAYYLIIPKEALEDSSGKTLDKSDTLLFSAKKISDYGSITLRFKNLDLSLHPVIQFLQADAIKFSYSITAAEWTDKRFTPGDYDIRILYDLNNNGIWDPGSYKNKRQPEKAILLPQKLTIKADWDNEREVQL